MTANEKLHLDFENNVVFYEVDKAEELLPMTEEELKAINEANDKFITDVIEAELFCNFNMCSCSTNEVMMRHIRRCNLLGKSPDQVPITLEQSDIDNYRYIIIVISENRKNLGVSTIIRECKKCHRWEIQGDSVSGSAAFHLTETPSRFTCDTVSGDVSLTIPGERSFEAKLSTASGDLRCDLPTQTVGKNTLSYEANGDAAAFTVDTVSGDFTISQS